MNTAFMLMAFYNGLPIVPVERVCADFFAPLSLEMFTRKVALGEIKLPIVRMEASKRGARGVHLNDLAAFLDVKAAAARKECEALSK